MTKLGILFLAASLTAVAMEPQVRGANASETAGSFAAGACQGLSPASARIVAAVDEPARPGRGALARSKAGIVSSTPDEVVRVSSGQQASGKAGLVATTPGSMTSESASWHTGGKAGVVASAAALPCDGRWAR